MKKQILEICKVQDAMKGFNLLWIKTGMIYYSMIWVYLVIKFVFISCLLNRFDTREVAHDLYLYRRRVAWRMKTAGLPIRPEAESLLIKKRQE